MPDVIIHDEPGRLVASIAHKGAYSTVSEAMQKADALLAQSGRVRDVAEMVVVYHDNPAHVAEADLRSHAGFVLKPGCHVPDGFEALTLEAGRYAVCTHRGAYSGLAASYDWLMNQWLPGSAEDYAGASMFEVYVNSPDNTPVEKLITKIYLPLEEEDYNGPV